jgi:hypothetical protein
MHLLRIYSRFDRHCVRIQELVKTGLAAQHHQDQTTFEINLNYAIIALHDAWSCRCRAIVLRSARGHARTASGRSLTVACLHPLAMLRRKGVWSKNGLGKSWEPKWYIPREVIRAAEKLGVANLAEIENGLGACIVADDIRVTRNAVVHSLPDTWAKFRTLQRSRGFRNDESPAEFAVSRVGNTGPRQIEEWLADLKACLRSAAK